MKPIAILKDSLREAWDSKILLVLLILSTLFSLLLASIAYHPVPAADVFALARQDFPRVRIDKGQFQTGPDFQGFNVVYEVKDVVETVPASNPANGEYQFTLVVTPGENQPPINRPGRKGGFAKGANEDENVPAPKKKGPEMDPFQISVLLWHIESKDAAKLALNPQDMPEADRLKLESLVLNSQKMEEFVKERYEYHYNVKIKAVQRVEGSLQGPQQFKVITAPSDPRDWPHRTSLFFGAIDLKKVIPPTSLGQIVYVIQNYLINGIGAAVAICLGVIVTSFFLPNMLRKGSIDLMLSKPISRVALLVYKYLGGLMFMLIFTTVTVISAWVVFGVTSGIWNPKFLLLIPLLTFAFAILYALSTLMSVWTRSPIASLLVTLAFSALLWILAFVYNQIDNLRNTPFKEQVPTWVYPTADTINAVLPRTRDLDVITTKLIADVMSENDQKKYEIGKQTMPDWKTSLGVSFLWISAFLSLASWRFSRKDY